MKKILLLTALLWGMGSVSASNVRGPQIVYNAYGVQLARGPLFSTMGNIYLGVVAAGCAGIMTSDRWVKNSIDTTPIKIEIPTTASPEQANTMRDLVDWYNEELITLGKYARSRDYTLMLGHIKSVIDPLGTFLGANDPSIQKQLSAKNKIFQSYLGKTPEQLEAMDTRIGRINGGLLAVSFASMMCFFCGIKF